MRTRIEGIQASSNAACESVSAITLFALPWMGTFAAGGCGDTLASDGPLI